MLQYYSFKAENIAKQQKCWELWQYAWRHKLQLGLDCDVRKFPIQLFYNPWYKEAKNFKNLMFCHMCWRLAQTDTNTVFNPVPPRQSDVRDDIKVACLRWSNKIAATWNKIWFQRVLIENALHINYKSQCNMCRHFYLTCVEIRFCCKLQQFCCSCNSTFKLPIIHTQLVLTQIHDYIEIKPFSLLSQPSLIYYKLTWDGGETK
jgi:hypothetical protein